jgi:hypothetical protein
MPFSRVRMTAIGWPLLITAVFLPPAIRRYRRLNR